MGERLQAQDCLSLLSGKGEERDSVLEAPEGPEESVGLTTETLHSTPPLELPEIDTGDLVLKASLTVPALRFLAALLSEQWSPGGEERLREAVLGQHPAEPPTRAVLPEPPQTSQCLCNSAGQSGNLSHKELTHSGCPGNVGQEQPAVSVPLRNRPGIPGLSPSHHRLPAPEVDLGELPSGEIHPVHRWS